MNHIYYIPIKLIEHISGCNACIFRYIIFYNNYYYDINFRQVKHFQSFCKNSNLSKSSAPENEATIEFDFRKVNQIRKTFLGTEQIFS